MLASPGSECRGGADDDFASAPPPSHPSEHSGSGDAALSSADHQTSLLALFAAEPLEMRLLLAATPGDGRLGRGDARARQERWRARRAGSGDVLIRALRGGRGRVGRAFRDGRRDGLDENDSTRIATTYFRA